MITNLWEKKGGLRRMDRESSEFIHVIEDLKLVYMEMKNGVFMQNNKKRERKTYFFHIRPLLYFIHFIQPRTRCKNFHPISGWI